MSRSARASAASCSVVEPAAVVAPRSPAPGRASASLTFSHYIGVPKNIAEEIISKSNGELN